MPTVNTSNITYSLHAKGDRRGGNSKCKHCKYKINVKGELFIKVSQGGTLHESSSTKFFHPECLSDYGSPNADTFVQNTLVDETKAKHLGTVEGKNKLVQDMNKDARTKNAEPASGAPARVLKKRDTIPDLETPLPWDPSHWKSEWDVVHPDNVRVRDMLIDVIKYYGERAAKGDDLAKVVAGAWIDRYVKVIDFVVGVKEEITEETAKALPRTSKRVISEETADCIAMYVSDGSLNAIIETIKAEDRDADECEEEEAAAKEAAATAKGDNKDGMESVRSDAEKEQQLKDAIQLSLVDAQGGDDNKDAGTDVYMEDVEKKAGEVEVVDKAAEEMDDDKDMPKENEEEV